ncbi:MAG: efflux RND transporter periplasmic adaptor subunit [Polyangiales bacterium]
MGCGWALGSVLALAACQSSKKAPEEVLRPVRVQRIRGAQDALKRRLAGLAQASQEAKLSFRVRGSLAKLNVKVGDTVKRGDLVAALDPADFHLEVQQAAAALGQAMAEERNAAANYRRTRALYENDNASKQDLDVAQAGAQSAAMQVSAARQRLQLARRQLGYTRLVAPAAGQIAEVPVEANENVLAGKTIAVLHAEGDIEVSVSVPESLISLVRAGDQAQVDFDALAGQRFAATVTEVGVSVAGATAFPVTLRLDGATDVVRPGMAAEVEFQMEMGRAQKSVRHRVPAAAVAEDRRGRYVYVAEPSGPGQARIRRRKVEIGKAGADGIEVRRGLNDGDQVVIAGVTRLKPGDRVRLPQGERP